MPEPFKLIYATMFNPPAELHERFDEALLKMRSSLGKEYGLIIDNKDVFADVKFGFIREAYLQRRLHQVYDGDVPEEMLPDEPTDEEFEEQFEDATEPETTTEATAPTVEPEPPQAD